MGVPRLLRRVDEELVAIWPLAPVCKLDDLVDLVLGVRGSEFSPRDSPLEKMAS